MKNGKIKLAKLTVEIKSVYDHPEIFNNYATEENADFSVEISEEDIKEEEKNSRAECKYEGIPYPEFSKIELENTAIYRKIAQRITQYDAIVFHASAVAVDGKCYLFTAKSGTGKTTHTKLWLKNINGSFVVNGDKPILRVIDGIAYVCGTPWMGKERYGDNIQIPLKSMCILERGKENKIEEISFSKALPVIYEQMYRPREKNQLIMSLNTLGKLKECVKFYRLKCNMNDDAAIVSYNGMCK